MKKLILTICISIIGIFNIFAYDSNLICETNEYISESDVVDSFFEEINKSNYKYQLWDYEIFKTKDKQNHKWITYKQYKNDNQFVYLFTNNGMLYFVASNDKFTLKNKNCINSEDKYGELLDENYRNVLNKFINESINWLSKFNESYTNSQLIALKKLIRTMIFCLYEPSYEEDKVNSDYDFCNMSYDYYFYRKDLLKKINDIIGTEPNN